MITIKGYHGGVSKEMKAKIDTFAKPIYEGYIWEFDGSVAQFSEKWDEKFLYYPHKEEPMIYITQYPSFNTR